MEALSEVVNEPFTRTERGTKVALISSAEVVNNERSTIQEPVKKLSTD